MDSRQKENTVSELRDIQILMAQLIGTVNEDTANAAYDAIGRVIDELRGELNTPPPVSADTEITRLRFEHFVMLDFVTRLATVDNPQTVTPTVKSYAITVLNQIAIDTPDTPPAGVTGSGARYVTEWTLGGLYASWDSHSDCFVTKGYSTEDEAEVETNKLNALHARLNAAPPASGNADTVAGSGNGGE